MKNAFSLPKKPAFFPALSLTSIARLLERATIEPASATMTSSGARFTWSMENVGSYLTMCCIETLPHSFGKNCRFGLDSAAGRKEAGTV